MSSPFSKQWPELTEQELAGSYIEEPADTAWLDMMQATADRVLARCTRVLVPLEPWEKLQYSCFCGRSPAVRISMCLYGQEMFWALACEHHQDEEVTVTLS
jgi:hypothetical protein